MPLRNTLALGVTFVLLGAYIYFFELQKSGQEKSQKLFAFDPADVESLALATPGREVQLKRDPSGKWRLTNPLQVAADDSTVGAALSALSAAEIQRTVEEKPTAAQLKEFGFEQPQVKVAIGLRRGGSLRPLLVGAKTPVGNSLYVKREIEPAVLLTNATLAASLDKKLYDWRDKRILDVKEDEVKQLSFKGAQGSFVLTKKDDDWFIDQSKPYRADRREVHGLLAGLSGILARDFIDEPKPDLKKYGLDRPRLQITLDMGEQQGRQEVLFGANREGKNEVYVRANSAGTVYTVLDSAFKGLDKNPVALRDKQLLAFVQDKVAKVRIEHGPNESLALGKGSKQEWVEQAATPANIQQQAVGNYLSALDAIAAKGFAEDEPKEIKKYGLDPPAVKVTLEGQDGKVIGALRAGRARDGYYAKREGASTVYVIDEASYKQINKRRDDFLVERKPTSAPAATKK